MDAPLNETLLEPDFDIETTETVDLQLDLACRASVARVQAAADELVEKAVS